MRTPGSATVALQAIQRAVHRYEEETNRRPTRILVPPGTGEDIRSGYSPQWIEATQNLPIGRGLVVMGIPCEEVEGVLYPSCLPVKDELL